MKRNFEYREDIEIDGETLKGAYGRFVENENDEDYANVFIPLNGQEEYEKYRVTTYNRIVEYKHPTVVKYSRGYSSNVEHFYTTHVRFFRCERILGLIATR